MYLAFISRNYWSITIDWWPPSMWPVLSSLMPEMTDAVQADLAADPIADALFELERCLRNS